LNYFSYSAIFFNTRPESNEFVAALRQNVARATGNTLLHKGEGETRDEWYSDRSNHLADPFMHTETPATIHLRNYAPTPFAVSHVDLDISLSPTQTIVKSILNITSRTSRGEPLVLDGEGLILLSVSINGVALEATQFSYMNDHLTITALPSQPFTLEIVQRCNPLANTALSGLYLSNGIFCTQMEAEGFRSFAFMYDRPDVMATYRVRIEASKSLPVLLSNGNRTVHGEAGEDMHYVVWEDPHPKPTYLFALVAGDLASVHDQYTTSEGRNVELGIYVEKGKQDRCRWAVESLKTSMRWDEERFGRAYDLDVFNIVAVSDFNMGAMENKGLNIFNDKYILARADAATDQDYVNIERIIAHEYFHNWTGNRITCRDWFQLCLKEGLTVFRDQEFAADMRSRAVKRIEDVKTLRARQFPEDQGPLAHAVRPSSYIEINNFYTPTIYEKGAEICRMMLTMLGRDTFRDGTDLFFERHDGEAATVEDFLRCMADASGRDLTQFARWYEQAGTPVVMVKTSYDATLQEFTAEISQHTPDTPGQTAKVPLHMPLALGLLTEDGRELPLRTKENVPLHGGIVELTGAAMKLTFRDVTERPVLSINRGFSAPVILQSDLTDHDLLVQLAHDSDRFNQWEAAQTTARRLLLKAYRREPYDIRPFAGGLMQSLDSKVQDDAFKALMLQFPGEAEITAALGHEVDASRVHQSRNDVLKAIAEAMALKLKDILNNTGETGSYLPDTIGVARRSLRLAAMALLSQGEPASAVKVALEEFGAARNMTLEAGALAAVLQANNREVDAMLDTFYQRHSGDHLLVDKWFMLAAARPSPKPAAQIETLTKHSAFTYKTPNRVYALIGGFTGGNLAGFHAADGSGYKLLADAIITLNGINPQVASRMATSFRSWKQYDLVRRDCAAAEMQRILGVTGLSNDVYEIISRTLA
jgi:aminopeptidase N